MAIIEIVMAKTMRATGMVLGALAGALIAAAPATADPPPRPQIDQKQAQFMKYLTDHGVPYTSAPDAVALAHTTCGILATDSPTRIQDAVTGIQNSISMRPKQIQLFASAAASSYCPDVKLS